MFTSQSMNQLLKALYPVHIFFCPCNVKSYFTVIVGSGAFILYIGECSIYIRLGSTELSLFQIGFAVQTHTFSFRVIMSTFGTHFDLFTFPRHGNIVINVIRDVTVCTLSLLTDDFFKSLSNCEIQHSIMYI